MTSGQSPRRLRVGVAATAVTPASGCRMQGYQMRRAERIEDPLSVSALAAGGDGVDWLLLCVDCIGLDRRFTRRVRARVAAALAMPQSAITVTSSHTHSGPATLPKLGDVEVEGPYLAWLENELERTALAAAADRQDVALHFGVTALAENVNRRVLREGRVELGVDPDGPVDNRLRVVRLDRVADGSPLALIVHYACHATVSGGVPDISADWPGAMRSALRSFYPGVRPPVVCFLQGCAGDVTHRIGRDENFWPDHFNQHTAVQTRILGRLAADAARAAAEGALAVEVDRVDVHAQALTLRYHRHFGSEQTELQVVRLGPAAIREGQPDPSIWILALPGEPFTLYSTELGEQLRRQVGAGEHRLLVCGYSNDAVGYLPTRAALREGGYEVARAHSMYQRRAPFAASTERRVLAQAEKAFARLIPSSVVADHIPLIR